MRPNTVNATFYSRSNSCYQYLLAHVRQVRNLSDTRKTRGGYEAGAWTHPTTVKPIALIKLDDGQRTRQSDYYHNHTGYALVADASQWAAIGNINVLPDGSLTQLSPELVEALGEPLDLPTPATLTSSNWRQMTDPDIRYLMNQGIWVDKRGTMAYLGSKYDELLANSGRRQVLEVDYSRAKPVVKLVRRAGKQIVAKHGHFLYRQKILVHDPYLNEEREATWVGLAANLPLKWQSRRSSPASRLVKKLHKWDALSALLQSDTSATGHPINRWTNTGGYTGQLRADEWSHWAAVDGSDRTVEPPISLLSSLNVELALASSPLSLQVRKLESQLNQKTKDLITLRASCSKLEADRTYQVDKLRRARLALAKARVDIDIAESTLPHISEKLIELSPKREREELRAMRIEKALAAKQEQFADREEYYRSQLSAGELPDYNAGLARSGIRICSLGYTNRRTGVAAKAADQPDVVVNKDWYLSRVHLQTTRPIVMSFGMGKEKHRVSGPHDIQISGDHTGYCTMTLAALHPWSVIGKAGDYFKVYPHTDHRRLDTSTPTKYWDCIRQPVTVCMGELSDSMSRAFRQNSPQSVALAVLSWLQSCNIRDAWGKDFKWFPTVDEVFAEEQVPSTQPPENVITADSATRDLYWILDDGTKYLRQIQGSVAPQLIYGNLQNGIEVSRNTEPLVYVQVLAGCDARWKGRFWKIQRLYRPVSLPNLPACRDWHPARASADNFAGVYNSHQSQYTTYTTAR